jgi:formate dehydrogenase iron-sulfur subunit
MAALRDSAVPTGRLLDGRPRAILFDASKCIGCRQCVHACKDWHDHPRTSAFELTATNWITIEPPLPDGQSRWWGRRSCMHCDYPMCAAVCPVEAIAKHDEGAVVIDRDACIGCDYCVYACPWGVIAKDPRTGKAEKCTMCSDRLSAGKAPFCVQACPVGALDFGPREEVRSSARQRAREIGGYLYGESEAGGASVVCVLQEPPPQHGLPEVGPERYPRHRIPLALMLKDLFTLRCGISSKLRALYLAIIHPRRLAYRYWPWRRPVVARGSMR